jgi:hypothetical protein
VAHGAGQQELRLWPQSPACASVAVTITASADKPPVSLFIISYLLMRRPNPLAAATYRMALLRKSVNLWNVWELGKKCRVPV